MISLEPQTDLVRPHEREVYFRAPDAKQLLQLWELGVKDRFHSWNQSLDMIVQRNAIDGKGYSEIADDIRHY